MKPYEFDINAAISKYSDKKNIPLKRLFLLGILAGAFIAIGAASSSAATHAISNVGLAKTVAGIIFPVGLIMIVFVDGELFTGDCLMFFGILDKRYSFHKILVPLTTVFVSNMVGAFVIALLVFFSGQFHYSDGMLGAYAIKVAYAKSHLTIVEAFTSGIICNILVSLAVLMAAGAKDIAGKVLLIFFPIFAFVIGGYEHCIANMYYITVGMLAALKPEYYEKAVSLYGLTSAQLEHMTISNMLLHNIVPVTLGNIVGGMVFVAIPLYLLGNQKKERMILGEEKFEFISKKAGNQKIL